MAVAFSINKKKSRATSSPKRNTMKNVVRKILKQATRRIHIFLNCTHHPLRKLQNNINNTIFHCGIAKRSFSPCHYHLFFHANHPLFPKTVVLLAHNPVAELQTF
ncbi:hypothetical protein D6783_05680 [Candidatus Woesearchaeota archaeon]|nr:MAG: hypothetical protein D6783_05680 [Candidatus Woesearchaeota archaeon]